MRPIWQVRRYYSHGFYGLQLWLTKAQFSQVCLMGNCCTGGWWPRAGADSACLLLSLHGMRFLRGRVEVVDSLATTPYYPNGYFQTCTVWKFHPVSIQQMRGYKLSHMSSQTTTSCRGFFAPIFTVVAIIGPVAKKSPKKRYVSNFMMMGQLAGLPVFSLLSDNSSFLDKFRFLKNTFKLSHVV